MSSTMTTTTTSSGPLMASISAAAGKKKFGKNLNKLTKPPAPSSNSNDSKSATSRNGLLLLSMNKRPTSSSSLWNTKPGTRTPEARSGDVAATAGDTTTTATTATVSTAATGTAATATSVSSNPSTTSGSPPDAWGVKQEAVAVDPASSNSSASSLPESQEVVMSKLARERSEKRRLEEETRRRLERERADQRLAELDQKIAREETVIHLSSYEDRDRGSTNTGPKMLYDPKSGSMVAVANAVNVEKRKKKKKEEKRKPKKKQLLLRKEPSSPVAAPKQRRRLPRTCGVLYARDEKGNCFCADGCEGDLGYGAHSVPGGKKELDWVKPNEKIELLTGMEEESPTLQATAKEWAPSQAALAAVLHKTESMSCGGGASVEDDNEDRVFVGAEDDKHFDEDTDDDDDITSFGLGFDPTQNMDSVIQSPSADPTAAGLDAVDLAALSLEPPISSMSNTTRSDHIFAFGSSATWGSTGAGSGSNDWGMPPQDRPASFLSLGAAAGSAWGGGVLGGGSGGGPTKGD